jgi:hypothetical protein
MAAILLGLADPQFPDHAARGQRILHAELFPSLLRIVATFATVGESVAILQRNMSLAMATA